MITKIFPIFLIIVTLIFHNDVISGTQTGLLLWYRSLIPALLPFILITNTLSELNTYQIIAKKLIRFCPNIYELLAVVLGNLCGYPIGAKILNDLVISKCISYKKANSLLAVSSQVSPMFLLGYIYNIILEKEIPLYIFLISIYLPVFILYIYKIKNDTTKEPVIDNSDKQNTGYGININNTFMQTVNTIVFIGIYVIIFSIILEILIKVIDSDIIKCLLSFMEITTGLNLIKNLSINRNLFFPITLCLSSFGGLCTMFQIKIVLSYQKASLKKYLPDKIIMSAGTFLIIFLYTKIKNY